MKRSVFVFLMMVCLAVNAQNTGSIKGVVTDSTYNKPVDFGVVKLTGNAISDRVEITDEKGEYAFINLPEGTYTIEFRAIGFTPQRIMNIVVTANKTIFLSPVMCGPRMIICWDPIIRGPYNIDDNPSSTTYNGDDIRKMAVPR